jgi:AcrR family transcriptional regulator
LVNINDGAGGDVPGQRAPEEQRREQILAAARAVAARDGIAGLTVRAVAGEAGLSHGLVLFHFKRKEQLVAALLDGVLEATLTLEVPPDVAGLPRALDRLRALMRREVNRLAHEPDRIRLLLECWALGARYADMRQKVGRTLARYRAAFLPLTEEVLASESSGFAGVTPTGLAAVTVGLINECAIQGSVDPEHFVMDDYLTAVQGLVGRLTYGGERARDRTA